MKPRAIFLLSEAEIIILLFKKKVMFLLHNRLRKKQIKGCNKIPQIYEICILPYEYGRSV